MDPNMNMSKAPTRLIVSDDSDAVRAEMLDCGATAGLRAGPWRREKLVVELVTCAAAAHRAGDLVDEAAVMAMLRRVFDCQISQLDVRRVNADRCSRTSTLHSDGLPGGSDRTLGDG